MSTSYKKIKKKIKKAINNLQIQFKSNITIIIYRNLIYYMKNYNINIMI